jgi:hypothetical protein
MRQKPYRLALAAGVALGLTAAPTATAFAGEGPKTAPKVRDCDAWASYPNIKISAARGMTCRAAVRDMRRYRGNIHRTFRTPGGFRCTRISGGPLSGEWRCTDRPRAYRFEFGD